VGSNPTLSATFTAEHGLIDRKPVIGILLHDLALGGTERVAIRLANAWSHMGCRVVLYVGEANGMQRALVDPAVPIVVADPPLRRSPGSRQRLGRWFGRRCAADGLEVAFLPGNFYFLTLPYIVAATRGTVRVYAKISNSLWRSDRAGVRNRFFAALTRHRLRGASGVVALSPGLLRQARQMLGPAINLVELPNPVIDALPQLPAPAPARRAGHLCAVGRLVAQKNFALLLRSFACLQDLPVTLDIIGDGEQRQMLEQLAGTLGIASRVRFLGAVQDVPQHVAQAEALLLTSDFEGYPGVIVEALSVGTFVVARDCSPAIGEMLASAGLGTVVQGADPARFAQAVRDYLQHRNSDVQQMRAFAATHTVDAVARRYLQLFGVDN
jgi:glycosyltransferase involved in cell wall biosynthesis